ncbi:hypothetical protein C8J57DRAFT_1260306 [Mycena rebaudengoi]|nr:hypothetical protein C8J57DRAFT_1260306 [Mycena rebaudengoi]
MASDNIPPLLSPFPLMFHAQPQRIISLCAAFIIAFILQMDQTPPNTPQRARISAQTQERDARLLDSPEHRRQPRPPVFPRPQVTVPVQNPTGDVFGGGPVRRFLEALNAPREPGVPPPRATPNTVAAMQNMIAELNAPRPFVPIAHNPRRPAPAPFPAPEQVQGPQQPIIPATAAEVEARLAELNNPRAFAPQRGTQIPPQFMPIPPAPPQPAPPQQHGNPEPRADSPPFPDFVAIRDLPRYFRPAAEASTPAHNLGSMDLICSKCGARHWKAEHLSKSTVNNPLFRTCCLDGKIQLPAIRAPPRELLELYNGTSHYSKEFLKNIRAYNAAFALASLGVTVDKSVLGGTSPYVFRIQGALHHKVGSLLPEEGQEPIYAQLYFYSPEEANAARMRRNQGLNSNSGLKQEVMNILDDVLRRNHAYIPLYKTAYERIKEQKRNHPNAPSEIYARITWPLLQQWIVDAWAATDQYRLNWLRNNQASL